MKTLKLKKLILSIVIALTAGVFLSAGWALAAGDIRGRVTYDNGITGVSSVRVSADWSNYAYTQFSSGDYEIRDVPDGTYYVTASKVGYTFSPSSIRVTVDGWDETGIDFTTPTYSISGVVEYDTGEGISGISVSVGVSGSDLTDYAGRYEIEGLENEISYSVSASKSGLVFEPSSQTVYISGSDETGVNFTCPTHSISGYVRYEDGSPVVGAEVYSDYYHFDNKSDTTDSSGYYQIDELCPHTFYHPYGAKEGILIYPSYVSRDRIGDYLPCQSAYIGNGDLSNVNFTAFTSSISGHVWDGKGQPIDGVVVSAIGGNSDSTDSNGYYEIRNLANGTHTVAPSKTGYSFTSQSVSINYVDVENIDFYSCDISGYVIDDNEAGINGATVTINGDWSGTLTTHGDISGNPGYYEKQHLASGNYTVSASYSDYIFDPLPQDVFITNSDRQINFYTYTIDGYIKRYGTNVGINGIDVTITGGDTPMNVILPTRNDDNGNPGYYKLEHVGGGNYTIEASEPDYAFYPTFQRDATSYEGITYNTTGLTPGIHYPPKKALMFNGTNGYVDCVDDNASLNITGSITVSAWVKLNGYTDWGSVFTKINEATSSGYGMELTSAHGMKFWIGDGDWLGAETEPLALNTWYHITGTYDGNYIRIYLNGASAGGPVAQGPPGSFAGNSAKMGRHGTIGTDPRRYFNGAIDEVTIYDRALEEGEIQSLANPTLDPPPTNLVAYYSFDDGTAKNEVSGNDGVLNGGITPIWRIQSLGKNALAFNGLNDYINCGTMPSLNITGNVTVAAWVKISDLNTYGAIFSKTSAAVDSGYSLEFNSNIAFWVGDGDWQSAPTSPLALDTWYHVAGTYNGTNIRIYLDGVLVGGPVAQNSLGSSADNSAKIGRHAVLADSTRFFNGAIDEIVVYDRALQESEIQSLMTGGPTIPDANLVVYYSFDVEE